MIKEKLGEGATGVVYEGKWSETLLAVKIVQTEIDNEKFKTEIKNAKLHESFLHRNIAIMYGMIEVNKSVSLITIYKKLITHFIVYDFNFYTIRMHE